MKSEEFGTPTLLSVFNIGRSFIKTLQIVVLSYYKCRGNIPIHGYNIYLL